MSVVVCTHNGSDRLPRTLEHVANQSAVGCPWEVIVVDNASADNTAKVAVSSWPRSAPAALRVLHEPLIGKMNGVRLGLDDASYDLVVLLDDDNSIARDWLANARAIMDAHPRVGLCGGSSSAVFEDGRLPPPWFSSIQQAYAVGAQAALEGRLPDGSGALWGAGMVVRRQAWQELLESGFKFHLTCRKGRALTAGGDDELCYAVRLAGWDLWYTPALRMEHCIPNGRLRWEYARRLFRGFGKALPVINAYRCVLSRNWSHSQTILVRRRWQSIAIQTIIRITRRRYAPLRALLTGIEGNQNVLKAECLIGELISVFRMRATLDDVYISIRSLSDRLRNANRK